MPWIEAPLEKADLYVLLDSEPRIESEALEYDGNATVDAGQRRAVAEDRALCRLGQPGHHSQDGGFAGARLTEERQHLAFPDFEADVIENRYG